MTANGHAGSGGYQFEQPPLPVPTKQELEQAGIKIAFGTPMERTVQDWAFVHFMRIAQRGWQHVAQPYGRTDINRNRLAKWLLDNPEFTHIVMLDLDHLHPNNIIERLASWVLDDPSKQVVAGLNFRRSMPFDPCVFIAGEDGQLHAPLEWQPGIAEVHATGHGAILIARSALEQLEMPFWAYSYQYADGDSYPSEDMYFSHICREAGIKLWCDTTLTSPHLTQNLVDADTHRRFVADHPPEQLIKPAQAERPNPRVELSDAASAADDDVITYDADFRPMTKKEVRKSIQARPA